MNLTLIPSFRSLLQVVLMSTKQQSIYCGDLLSSIGRGFRFTLIWHKLRIPQMYVTRWCYQRDDIGWIFLSYLLTHRYDLFSPPSKRQYFKMLSEILGFSDPTTLVFSHSYNYLHTFPLHSTLPSSVRFCYQYACTQIHHIPHYSILCISRSLPSFSRLIGFVQWRTYIMRLLLENGL